MTDRRADLIIQGRIATLAGDRGFGWVEAIAIGSGRILAAGRATEIAVLAGQRTRTWRLGTDEVVLPAITDAHLHLLTAAQEATEVALGDAPDRAAILARIHERAQRMNAQGDDGWLLGHGWSLDRMGSWPTADDLDRVAPGRPVSLVSHDHHSRWVSRAALRAAGIDAATPDPEGGLIRRGDRGEPSGLLHEHATKLVFAVIPRMSDARLEAALAEYAARLAVFGVVAAQDPGELGDDAQLRWGPTFYRRLATAGRLPLRVASSIRPEQLEAAVARGFRSGERVAAAAADDPAASQVAARYRGGWLKLFADGALGSRSAALLAPYEDEDDWRRPVGGPAGMLLEPAQVLGELARRASAAGIAVQIHGIGDAAVRAALDILATLPSVSGDIRHRVEHAQLIDPTDIGRFGASGIVASVQPCHLAGDAPMARAAWGARTAWAFPLRSLSDRGAILAFGTDAPVESADPWPGIALAVSRAASPWEDSDGPFHPEQAIDLARAIRGACLGPASSASEMDRGRLVAGCRADLIVVDAAALDEPVRSSGALTVARPSATLLDGEIVHRAEGFGR